MKIKGYYRPTQAGRDKSIDDLIKRIILRISKEKKARVKPSANRTRTSKAIANLTGKKPTRQRTIKEAIASLSNKRVTRNRTIGEAISHLLKEKRQGLKT